MKQFILEKKLFYNKKYYLKYINFVRNRKNEEHNPVSEKIHKIKKDLFLLRLKILNLENSLV